MSDFSRLIPRTVGGLTASGEDAVYDRKALYDYMDGGAEVYLAFDFREVWTRRYAGPGALELTLDIYDMDSPGEAFGIFSCDREDPPAAIGQDATYGFGLLRFWRGRWFVTVTASAEDDAVAQVVLALGREVVEHLGPPGPYPALLNLLPQPSLRSERTSYFHSVVNLNNRFFISSENILGLGRDTDGVFAEYETGAPSGGSGALLLVRYLDESRAAEARRSFLAAYLPEAGPDGLALTEQGRWTLAVRQGSFIAVVFEAPSAAWARNLVAAIKFPE